MKIDRFEFMTVRVSGDPGGSHIIVVGSFEEAFYHLGMRGTRWTKVSDGGDRIIIEELSSYRGATRRSAVFHLDGVQHLSAKVVISLYQRTLVAEWRPIMAFEVEGFRHRPVSVRKWSLRGVFGSPRVGCERRANSGMRGDEDLAYHGLSPRPCRRFVRGYRFERPEAKDANWKRFRNTRWRDGG
ncbi:hypothetical protein OIU34_18755 [Pararhizobium sp. BT-229]|uniref:hypothetical protein n=1 Tax=Pararhizobium sp. BT-229 TaxID=2986923 RepID=UPI0021F76C8A|nr:hypothetical protein [Pararhizobium sp. BT-229]MCV9963921.1 hypothetical protein [Pararhizobium sp. BT-229]